MESSFESTGTARSGACPVLDAHCHIGPYLRGEELIGMMDRGGVECVCNTKGPLTRKSKGVGPQYRA